MRLVRLHNVNRRKFLATSALGVSTVLTGCSGGASGTESLTIPASTSVPVDPPDIELMGQTEGADRSINVRLNAKQMSSIVTSGEPFLEDTISYRGEQNAEANILVVKIEISNEGSSQVTVDLSRFVYTTREDDIVTREEDSSIETLGIESETITVDSGGSFEATLVYEISNAVTDVELSFETYSESGDNNVQLATPEGDTVSIVAEYDESLAIDQLETPESILSKLEVETDSDSTGTGSAVAETEVTNITTETVASFEFYRKVIDDRNNTLDDNLTSISNIKPEQTKSVRNEYEVNPDEAEGLKTRIGPLSYSL